MGLLTQSDYEELKRMNVVFREIEAQRFLIFTEFPLPSGTFSVSCCEILVVIPPAYPSQGNDMFWTWPRIERLDGKIIPGTIPAEIPEGNRDTRTVDGKVFERWSRHWNVGQQVWRAGRDNVVSIINRLSYVLSNSLEG
jgi:hypothetical protein